MSKILWSAFGENLTVVDSEDISMRYLTEVLKRPSYKARYRLFVLNPDETIAYEIPQEDIIANSGSFTENYQNGQRKSLNINLVNVDGKYTPSINGLWVHTKFRFDIGLEFDGNVYWFKRGIYILNNPTANHQQSDKQMSLSLVDKFALFEGKMGVLETTYEIPVDSDIRQAIEGILTIDNGSGYPLDLQPIVYDKAFDGLKMPYTLTKDAGSTLGEMLLELATILSAEMYYNSDGYLCVVNINETTLDVQKASLWDYNDNEPNYFNANLSYDFENAINEIQIVGDSVDNAIFSAYARNENPISPLCIQRIGRRISYISDTNIYSTSLAQQRALYELRKVSILNTTMSLNVSFNPLLFVNNLINITDNFYNYNRERFLIKSISYNIGNENQMSISCSNIVSLDYVDWANVIGAQSNGNETQFNGSSGGKADDDNPSGNHGSSSEITLLSKDEITNIIETKWGEVFNG